MSPCLRILADDLTGALDAAAPFARPEAPVRLLLDAAGPGQGHLTISSESRDLSPAEAEAAVARVFARLAPAPGEVPLWFKKVDSVLRGNSLAETLAMMRAGGFARCIFAPAFPGMGRRTREGLHEVQGPEGWGPAVVHDLRRGFADLGVGARIFAGGEGGQMPEGVVIGDAVAQSDLDAVVAAARDLPGTLWAGSRGLAEALSEAPVRSRPQLPLETVVVGTTHPATREQIRRALAAGALRGDLAAGADGPVRLVDPVPAAADDAETRRALRQAAAGIRPHPGRALMVIGGDTLSTVLAATGARFLDCLGEVGPGLPASRILGGTLDGVEVISKSGGFGAPDLLERMAAARGAATPA